MFEILARQLPFKQIYEESNPVMNAQAFLDFVKEKKKEKGGLPLVFPPQSELPIRNSASSDVIERYAEIAQVNKSRSNRKNLLSILTCFF